MRRLLRPVKEAEPEAYGSVRLVLQRPAGIQLAALQVGGVTLEQATAPDEVQQKILTCLGIQSLV